MKALADEEDIQIDLTPVIDCVFNLLIFFLVATQFETEERELDIKLPEAAQAQPLSMTPEIVVNLKKDGAMVIDRNPYDQKQLLAMLVEAKKNNPKQAVLIRADADTPWRYGVAVMGLCNKARISEYRVAALGPEDQP